MHANSGGRFDPTIGPLSELWDFRRARVPDADALAAKAQAHLPGAVSGYVPPAAPDRSAQIRITPEGGEAKEYLIAKGKHLTVKEGDYLRAGEALMDGPANPHDILKIKGEKALAEKDLAEAKRLAMK